MGGPCDTWAVERCGCSAECWTGYRPATRERAAALAIAFMWAATGRRYGPCEVTVLPCNPAPPDPLYQDYSLTPAPGGPGPYIDAGTWRNAPCGTACTCTAKCEVPLPGPVASVVEVLIDGEAVDPDAYRVFNHELLARVDGGCWPTCQTYGVEIPGFEAVYMRGVAIPSHIQYGTEGLACQFAKSCEGSADCALPPRMRSLTRQGVAIEVATEESRSVGGKLRTEIKWIDDIIAADNPYGLAEAPQVLSLDLPEPRVITSVGGS